MDSMYSGLLEEIAKKISSDATSVEEAASIIRSALADLKSDKDKGESVKIHSVGAMDSEALSKYEQFFQAWLGLSVTRMKSASGILIASNDQLKHKALGWMLYVPVFAFETEAATFVSCIPEWVENIRSLLDGKNVADAIPLLNAAYNQGAPLSEQYYMLYGLEALNETIDTSRAILLGKEHRGQLYAFFKRIYPTMFSYVDYDEWVTKDFPDMVEKEVHFCVFEGDEIVCVTESENTAGKPSGVINLGVNTLKEHRRKGYAAAACAAFIERHVGLGNMPIWKCAFTNAASRALAEKLGFRHMGNVFTVTSIKNPVGE